MNEAFYRQTSRIEAAHWWFRHRRALVRACLPGDLQGGLALDLGCGTGGNAALLGERAALVIGLDRSELALRLAREKGSRTVWLRADANRVGSLFKPASFTWIASLNVLYHAWIEDDRSLLRTLAALLRPGGALLLTEPAHRWLRRRHDVVDFGARRYRLREVVAMAGDAGLRVERATHFNAIALVPAALLAAADRLAGRLGDVRSEGEEVGELAQPPALIRRAVELACALERRFIGAGRSLPVGVGLLVVARRSGADPEHQVEAD